MKFKNLLRKEIVKQKKIDTINKYLNLSVSHAFSLGFASTLLALHWLWDKNLPFDRASLLLYQAFLILFIPSLIVGWIINEILTFKYGLKSDKKLYNFLIQDFN